MNRETERYRQRAANELDTIQVTLNLFRESLRENDPFYWSVQGLVKVVERLGVELKNWKDSHEADARASE